MIKPCNSRNFYYFPLDPHLNHLNLDKDHCNFPMGKAKIIVIKIMREDDKRKNYSRIKITHSGILLQREYKQCNGIM